VLVALTVTNAFFLLLTSHYATAGGFFALAVLTLAGWHAHEPAEAEA